MYSRTRDEYYSYETSLFLNAYYCTQSLYLLCKNSKYADNSIGTVYYQSNKTETILQLNPNCKSYKDCSCYFNNYSTVIYTSHIETKYLPIRKICVSKLRENGSDPSIPITSGQTYCYARQNFLKSVNKEIIDVNLQTCSKNVNMNRIYLNKFTKSSMEIIAFYRFNQKMKCENIEFFYKDGQSCNENSYKKCWTTGFRIAKSIPLKICKYFCPIGIIKEILITKKFEHFYLNIEICDIFLSLLDTNIHKH